MKNGKGGMQFDKPNLNGFKLFCDLDGVLTDIEQSFRALHPRFEKIPKRQVWDAVEQAGVSFWEMLPWTDDGRRLWHFIEGYRPQILTAAPSRSRKIFADSRKGKQLWIRRELGPEYAEQAIVCRRNEKADAAATGHILIDDYASIVTDWQRAGGIGILHTSAQQTIESLKRLAGGDGGPRSADPRRWNRHTAHN
jgi:hypothetical protein